MKQILCAMLMPHEIILREIHRFGNQHGWQVEFCDRSVPPGWRGDGVLTDSLPVTELRKIRDFDCTPVVSRTLMPGGNIRTVAGDTRRMAVLIADYFQNKGFRNFAAVDARDWNRPECVPGIDPVISLEEVLAERGIQLQICHWQADLHPEETAHYDTVCGRLESFFTRLPRPTALFIPNGRHLAVAYRVIRHLGIRVPEEFAVLCNADESFLIESATIPTTHISGEPLEFGRKMTNLLERMMSGETVPELPVRVTPSAIVSRHSTDALAVSSSSLATAVAFLQKNYMNLISIEDAAAAADISHSMLVRLFRKQLHKSPSEFLREQRFNRIRYLLDKTNHSLSEVARQTGYGSSMSLSLAFRREYRLSPGEYRRARRNESEGS